MRLALCGTAFTWLASSWSVPVPPQPVPRDASPTTDKSDAPALLHRAMPSPEDSRRLIDLALGMYSCDEARVDRSMQVYAKSAVYEDPAGRMEGTREIRDMFRVAMPRLFTDARTLSCTLVGAQPVHGHERMVSAAATTAPTSVPERTVAVSLGRVRLYQSHEAPAATVLDRNGARLPHTTTSREQAPVSAAAAAPSPPQATCRLHFEVWQQYRMRVWPHALVTVHSMVHLDVAPQQRRAADAHLPPWTVVHHEELWDKQPLWRRENTRLPVLGWLAEKKRRLAGRLTVFVCQQLLDG